MGDIHENQKKTELAVVPYVKHQGIGDSADGKADAERDGSHENGSLNAKGVQIIVDLPAQNAEEEKRIGRFNYSLRILNLSKVLLNLVCDDGKSWVLPSPCYLHYENVINRLNIVANSKKTRCFTL